ncbi:hypothetical protein Indivirus_8_6 [Indivirus ILV1]|uniref:Uncharacterized protein n=1 Tax=Indivirus ILV1 TaxID=1977633 RepID=A0A1V0SE79_9VIRU|nr:hypothetical protein Indivirus_8_6 [Indivirus ILV1]
MKTNICMIVFSITAHENLECLCDLLDNIKKCFVNYSILILLSITENLCHEQLETYDFVKIVNIRPKNVSIWGNIDLFHQHILNINYIYEKSITYDYFWFVASNEMFIKIISSDFLDNFSLKIIDKQKPINELDYDIYFEKLKNEKHSWSWIEMAKNDIHFMNYIYKNKFILYGCQHEGLVLSSDIVLEIFNEYNKNKLYEHSTFKNYVMEELFISTYILNKYIISTNYINTFCFRYIYTIKNVSSYEQIENELKNHHVSIKPVRRDYNDPIRTYIRKKI